MINFISVPTSIFNTSALWKINSIPAAAEINEKGENNIRTTVTHEGGMTRHHFGRMEQFIIHDVSGKEITASQIIDTNGTGNAVKNL